MTTLSQYIVILFGLFIIAVGFLMLIKPSKAKEILRKAGSTNLINYAEITIRMIPAAAMMVYSDYSKFPEVLYYFGGFMIATSMVLYFVPRRWHHKYATVSADILTPTLLRVVSPFSVLFGAAIIYSVW